MKINIFWFRRDLRLDDNTGLSLALKAGLPVLPIFIFDEEIITELDKDDARVQFIHESLNSIHSLLKQYNSSLLVIKGKPLEVWEKLAETYSIDSVFTNKDYEPYAISRDQQVKDFLSAKQIEFNAFKDQVIFEANEVLKPDGTPYTVFTPYKNKWHQNLAEITTQTMEFSHLMECTYDFPSLKSIGFQTSPIKVPPFNLDVATAYAETRDIPSLEGTSHLSVHLRFGTVSVRKILQQLDFNKHIVFINELVWREFFMQILFHFPFVVHNNFRSKYDAIEWRNNEEEFEKWCNGQTGYPIVDAGMRELNQTGFMHNRVRMITASFLCKHLLINWQWGEAYFAKKLLDYDLSSNNGNWQWAAGTGCDAAPYFRVFNPYEQTKRFDSELKYIKKWIPELDTFDYPSPIVDHKFARQRALDTYKKGINAQ